MSLPEVKQAEAILNKASHVLLIIPPRTSADAFASMVALYLALQTKESVRADQVSPSHVPAPLQFLPGSSQVTTHPQERPDVILDIAGPSAITEVRTEQLTGGVRLHISFPDGVVLKKEQLEVLVRPLPYDVAVVFGAADLETLGVLFTKHADFFYNTPILNIDNRADNEHFGTVNLVDITASAIAQVTYELIEQLVPTIDSNIATALYAGMIAGTDSFQKPSTTPAAFKIAAELLELKANRDAVIQHLVKTKPLSLLKLVGRLYARLRHNEHTRVFSSVLKTVDFAESGATDEDLASAIHELTNNISDFTAAAVIHEHDGRYDVYLVLGKGLRKRRSEIQTELKAERLNGFLRLTLPAASLPEADSQLQEKLRGVVG